MSYSGCDAVLGPTGLSCPIEASAAKDRTRQADTEVRSVMAAGVVHDLTNMLTVVLGSLEQMRR